MALIVFVRTFFYQTKERVFLEKLRDLRDTMPRHWSLCFLVSPYYVQDLMPCQWLSSDLSQVLRI